MPKVKQTDEDDPPHDPRSENPSQKRPCSSYDRLVHWILTQDDDEEPGYVHPSVSLTNQDGDRCLSARPSHKADPGTEVPTKPSHGTRAVVTKGEVVLRIPRSVLIAPSTIRGCWRHDNSSEPSSSGGATTIAMGRHERALHRLVDEVASSSPDRLPLRLPRADVQLALYLLSKPARIQPYLGVLPDEGCDQDLPRCWDDEALETLLQGSPLLQRVRKQQRDVQDDYRTLQRAYGDAYRAELPGNLSEEAEETGGCSLGSLSDFSRSLAAVTSRAFEGLKGFEVNGTPAPSDPMLVPLLDLCNHSRGRTAPRNLTYRYDAARHGVVVEAAADLKAGEPLTITYGAQGNGPLLLNYGFCVPNNLEPDGSSNSSYDFCPFPDATPEVTIPLRAGPKSYSYGGLVRALECFRRPCESPSSEPMPRHDGDLADHDMGRFTAKCEDAESSVNDEFSDDEEDEETNQDSHDAWYREPSPEAPEESPLSRQWEALQNDLVALQRFQECLKRDRALYAWSDVQLDEALRDREYPRRRYYAALLVQSEWRTLRFFDLVVRELVRRWLRPRDSSALLGSTAPASRGDGELSGTGAQSTPPAWMTPEDEKLVSVQVKDLAEVFVRIRYPAVWSESRGSLPEWGQSKP